MAVERKIADQEFFLRVPLAQLMLDDPVGAPYRVVSRSGRSAEEGDLYAFFGMRFTRARLMPLCFEKNIELRPLRHGMPDEKEQLRRHHEKAQRDH